MKTNIISSLLALLTAIILGISTAAAAPNYVSAPGATSDWDLGTNWGGTAPTTTGAGAIIIRNAVNMTLDNGKTYVFERLGVSNGSNTAGNLTVNNGTLSTTSTTADFYVGDRAGGVGILTVNTLGSITNTASNTYIGGNNSTGTATLNGGTLNLKQLYIGTAASGNGTLTVNSGTLSTADYVTIGHTSGNGTLNLNGGSIISANHIYIGQRSGSGTGFFNMAGGNITLSTVGTYIMVASNTVGGATSTKGTAIITGGNLDANLLVGNNTASEGRLVFGSNVTIVKTVNGGNLTVRQGGAVEFQFSNSTFKTIEFGAGSFNPDHAEIKIDGSGFNWAGTAQDPTLTRILAQFTSIAQTTEEIESITTAVNFTSDYRATTHWLTNSESGITTLTLVVDDLRVIPEPATCALILSALAATSIFLRKKRK